MMQNEVDILRDVAAKLDAADIGYMLTGSMAMNYYAQPRMTRDIDLVLAATATESDLIVRLFSPDYYVSRDAVVDSIACESVFNLIHNESVIKVDCVVRKGTVYRRLEFERRRRIRLTDFEIWITSKEDLIISKLAWARNSHSERQLGDVRNLLQSGCDIDYVGQWTRELGLASLWAECQI